MRLNLSSIIQSRQVLYQHCQYLAAASPRQSPDALVFNRRSHQYVRPSYDGARGFLALNLQLRFLFLRYKVLCRSGSREIYNRQGRSCDRRDRLIVSINTFSIEPPHPPFTNQLFYMSVTRLWPWRASRTWKQISFRSPVQPETWTYHLYRPGKNFQTRNAYPLHIIILMCLYNTTVG